MYDEFHEASFEPERRAFITARGEPGHPSASAGDGRLGPVSARSDLTQLLANLVAIDSVNPELVRGGAGEGEVGRFVAEWLERAGLEVTLQEIAPGRSNVVGVRRGRGGGRSLVLNAHMDTVGVAGMDNPHGPRI